MIGIALLFAFPFLLIYILLTQKKAFFLACMVLKNTSVEILLMFRFARTNLNGSSTVTFYLFIYLFFYYSWCFTEGSGGHSYHENKEVGSGPWEDSTISVSVYLSLPQTWCQWTTGKDKVCVYWLFHLMKSKASKKMLHV